MKKLLMNDIKYISIGVITLLTFAVTINPIQANAFEWVRLVDPLCLTCNKSSSQTVINNVTVKNTTVDSYNKTTIVNSDPYYIAPSYRETPKVYTPPVIKEPYIVPPTVVTPVVVNPVVINPPYVVHPAVTYNYSNYYPDNNYNYYHPYRYNNPLSVTCYPSRTNVNVGDYVTWYASVNGGNGSYYYSWLGNDGLYGYGSSISKTYNYAGTKYASVTVTSDGQSVTQSCYNNISVSGYYNNYNYNNYNYPTNYYQNNNTGLQIACYPDKVNARVGAPVTWAVEVFGNLGNIAYSWTGTDGLSSNQSTVITTYGTTGSKSATVTVSSNGQTLTQACGSTVNITSAVAPVVVKKVAKPIVAQNVNQNVNQQDNSQSAASLFSLKNVPWGWVAVLVILTLIFTVIYLIINRNKI